MALPLDELEQRLSDVAAEAMRTWLSQVEPAVAPESGPVNPDAVAQYQQQWRDAVDTVVMPEVTAAATDVFLAAGGVLVAGALTAWLLSQLSAARGLLLTFPAEVTGELWKAIATGQQQGEDAEALRARVRRVLSWSLTDRWPERANMAGIGMAGVVENGGRIGAGLQQNETAPDANRRMKRWRTRGDERVRATHREANGQTVPMSMPFLVGGAWGQYPQDPALPAQERVNCRCRVDLVRRMVGP